MPVLFALRLLFIGATSSLVLYIVFLQPFRKETFDLLLALLLGSWAVCLLILRWVPKVAASRLLRVLDLVLFNLCLAAVLAEGALRIVALVSPSPLLAQDDVRALDLIRAQAAQQRPGELRFGFPFNAQRHYDTDFAAPGAFGRRIASIGDSFSVGVVPHYFHFTTVIERQLDGVDVENFGYPGIGPYEYLHLLRRDVLPRAGVPRAGVTRDLDLIAVNVFVGNDLTEAKRFKLEHRALRLWLDRDNVLLYTLPRRLMLLRQARLADASGGTVKTPIGGIAGESRDGLLTTPEAMIEAYPWLADSTLEQPSFPLPGVYLHIESERALAACDPQNTDPAALFATLREMKRLAGQTPFAVHLLPDDFQVDDELWREILEHTGRTDLIRDLPQQLIIPWLDAAGIPYLDLLPIFRQQCGDHHGGRHCYHRWDSHFNARGNRVAGEAMARFLAPIREPAS